MRAVEAIYKPIQRLKEIEKGRIQEQFVDSIVMNFDIYVEERNIKVHLRKRGR